MSEANLWDWLRGVVLPLGQFSRIESEITPGFPDVHCQFEPGVSPTLELKFARNPSAHIPFTEEHGIRKSQLKWIRENIRYGGEVWIIAEVSPEIFIIPGAYVEHINGATKEELTALAEGIIHRANPVYAAGRLKELLLGD